MKLFTLITILSLSSYYVLGQVFNDTIVDIRTQKVYRIVNINNTVWMAENLDFDTGFGCRHYVGEANSSANTGMLYELDAALTACPSGWRLPTEHEWNDLIYSFGRNCLNEINEQNQYYTTDSLLFNANYTAFNVQFGGIGFCFDEHEEYSYYGTFGDYRASPTTNSTPLHSVKYRFDSNSKKMWCGECYKTNAYSVRCVKK